MVNAFHQKLVFLDEAVFSFNTFNTKAWSAPYKSIIVKEDSIRVKTFALLAAISEDRGLETFLLQPRSFNSEHFI